MGRTFDRGLLFGLGLVAVLLVANGLVSYRNTRQLSEDAGWVAHTHEVLDALGDILLAVREAESAGRAFLLTSEPAVRDAQAATAASVTARIDRVAELTDDNDLQQRRIPVLRALVAERLAVLDNAIRLHAQGQPNQGQGAGQNGPGRRAMTAVQALIEEMAEHERGLLRDRRGKTDRAYRTAVSAGVAAAAIGVGSVALFAWVLHRNLAARGRAAATIHAHRELLRATLVGVGDGLIATDATGRITLLNPVAQALTGWVPEEAAGRPLEEVFRIVNEDTRATVENPAVRALRDGVIVGLANHTLLIARDGTERAIDDSAAPVRDAAGEPTGAVLVFRDVTERRAIEHGQEERARLAAFGRDVGLILTRPDPLPVVLGRCAAAMVDHLGAAFARVWTLNDGGSVLELQASAGLYTHTDGPHARVPVGTYKIGRIAQARAPHLSNDVPNDPEVSDSEWARREGMVGFAGYPLIVDDRVVGVMAMFARRPLSAATLEAIGAVADGIAIGIDRKQTEDRLRDQQEWLRITLASIGDGVIATDPAGRVLFLNPAAEVLTGWLRAEAVGRPLEEVFRVVSEDTGEPVPNPATRAVAEGVVVELANHTALVARDGTTTPVADSTAPIRDARGVILGAVLVFRAVADERQARRELEARVRTRTAELGAANAALQARARQQAAVAEFGHRGLAGADPDALMVAASSLVAEALGVPYARVVEADGDGGYRVRAGAGWGAGVVDGVLAPDEAPLIDYALRTGEPVVCDDWRAEARFARPPLLAAHGVVSSVAAPVPGPDRPFGVLAVDATAARAFTADDRHFVQAVANVLATAVVRRSAEDAVRAAAAELRRSNGELEQFAYVASHDLQEPLRKIQAFGDRLRDKCRDQLGGTGQEYLDRMLASAARMSRLIDDLLAFSRVATQARSFTPVDLGAVAREVMADLETRIEQTGGRVEIGDLPTTHADPTQMRQLLQNLIGNGLKFHKAGEPPVIRVGGRAVPGGEPDRDACELTVADAGIGFDEKYRDRIFQVFQRLHGRGEYDGTGVGLAICKKIVERHGGTITAHSSPGHGATFVVTLPARPPAAGSG